MKIKNTLLRIISLVLVIVMLLPTNVYADKVNGGGSDSGGDIGGGNGGVLPNYRKTGWLVYVAKKQPMVNGTRKPGYATIVDNKIVYVNVKGKSEFPSDYDDSYLRPRLNPNITVDLSKQKEKYSDAPWGTPFTEGGDGRGDDIRKLFEDDKNDFSKNPDQSDMEWVIINYLGKSIYKEVMEDPNDYYLMLEACAWYSTLDKNGKYRNYVASAYGWPLLFKTWDMENSSTWKKNKWGDRGDGRGWISQYRLQRGCYLTGDWSGLPKAPEKSELGKDKWDSGGDGIGYNQLLKDIGYGMMVIKTNLQTTCNETLKVPHHPVPEANGDYQIVKNYVIKNADGTYESVKCTSKLNSFKDIKIEQEKKYNGYRLKSYIVTTKKFAIPKNEKGEDDYYPQDRLKNIIDKNGKLVWKDRVKATGDVKRSDSAPEGEELKEETIHMDKLKGGRTVFLLLIKDADAQTTCNEKQKEPHQPPDESKGTYTIIKNYVDKKGDTYKSKKCTSKTNSSPIITVEPEEETTGYKLVAYAATTKKYTDNKTEHNPLNLLAAVNDEGELVWENAVKNKLGTNKMFKGSQKNTTELKGGTFNLTKDELKGAKTVYLLLIKEDEDIQTTCDEDIPTPHPAPNESKGTYKIVKNYVTKTDDTYTDDGCYSRTNVANKIKIEDEAKTTGYHLEAWKVSTNTKSPVTSVDKHSKLVWDENVPPTVKKKGSKPTTVDLKEKGHEGKTVYLLLVRDKSKVQTTCDEPIPTPHPAPNESTGTYKIVKNYVTDSNGKYKDDGCFCKTKVTHQIKIEDESTTTGYTLVAWKATDSSTESVTSVAGFIFFAFF